MTYNFKRALGISFALYVATFIVGIAMGVLTGQDMSSMDNISDNFWYVGMVSAVIFTALATLWYFRNPAIMPSTKSGLFFGLTAVGFSILIDVILFSIGNVMGASVDIIEYYSDYRFWIIVILVLGTAKLVGYLKRPQGAGTFT